MTQVEWVVRLVDRVLGADRIGIYLHGSSVLGGLRPASDLDVMVVSRRSLDDERRAALVAGLLPISGSRAGARPIELTIVVQSDIRPWRYPPTADFLYGEWLRDEYEAGRMPQPEPMTDLPLEIAVLLAGDQTLAGPPAAEVFDPVPQRDLAAAASTASPA